jgi:23S rRNA pseudouridine1911/1915/1917 synthase
MRLDVALIKRHPELSRRRARDVIEKGQVTLDGQVVLEPGLDVAELAAILWDANRKARKKTRSAIPLLFEDEKLLIVDKPAGLLAVPTSPEAHDEDTALARVMAYVAHLRPRRPYVGLVHRLDRDTSGALMFALDPETRKELISLVSTHRVERQYLALVRGEPKEEKGRVDLALHEEYEGGRRRVARPGEPARPAVTHWQVRERFPGAALLEVRLETGRQHQIRVHLSHAGHAVLGDRRYAPAAAEMPGLRVPRQMLHAERLGFDHPWTEDKVTAVSPIPADFETVLKALRRRAPGDRAPRR